MSLHHPLPCCLTSRRSQPPWPRLRLQSTFYASQVGWLSFGRRPHYVHLSRQTLSIVFEFDSHQQCSADCLGGYSTAFGVERLDIRRILAFVCRVGVWLLLFLAVLGSSNSSHISDTDAGVCVVWCFCFGCFHRCKYLATRIRVSIGSFCRCRIVDRLPRDVTTKDMTMWPNQSPEPTAVAAAVAIHVASRRWFSFGR